MADNSEKSEQSQLFIKVVYAINYVTSVCKKKPPTSSRIQKYLFKNEIYIKDGLLEILLDQLEEGVIVNYEDTNESAYKVVKDLNSFRNPIIFCRKVSATQ